MLLKNLVKRHEIYRFMEKLKDLIFPVIICVFVTAMLTVSFLGLLGQRNSAEYNRRALKRENRRLELKVEDHEYMFGKYVDSISDMMLHDFYPEVNNLDSLRSRLKERYEIMLIKEQDGLCY